MQKLYLFLLFCLLSTSVFAQQRDSIDVTQFVKNSFTQYGIKNALVTVKDSAGNIIDTVRTAPGNGSHDAQVELACSSPCDKVLHKGGAS